MGLRLERAIDDVNRLERKILMYQAQKKQALERLKQVENEEIIRSIRGLSLERSELVELLKGLQEGTVRLTDVQQTANKSEEENAGSIMSDNDNHAGLYHQEKQEQSTNVTQEAVEESED